MAITALLTAPLMGDLALDLDNKWGRVVVDGLIGEATVVGGVVGLVAAGATLYGLGYGACALGRGVVSLGMFSNRNQANANASSVPAIDSDVGVNVVINKA